MGRHWSFFPSISLNLFTKSADFAKSVHNISDKNSKITMSTTKTLLFYHEEPWKIKSGEERLNAIMRCC